MRSKDGARSYAWSRIEAALELDEETIALRQANIEPGSFDHLRDWLPYQKDELAQACVSLGGLTGEQIGELLHLDPSTIDREYAQGVAKLRALAEQHDEDGDAAREWIADILARAEDRAAYEATNAWMDGREGKGP